MLPEGLCAFGACMSIVQLFLVRLASLALAVV